MSYEWLDNEFLKFNDEIRKFFNKGEYNKAAILMEIVARFYYYLNYKFSDDFLEDSLIQLKDVVLRECNLLQSKKTEKIMLYDGTGDIDRGLGRKYIETLHELGYHLHILVSDEFITKEGRKVYTNLYRNENNIEVDVLPDFGQDIINRMIYIYERVSAIMPKAIFLYQWPYDISGSATFSKIKNIITCYYIEHIDHTFWLGRNRANFFLNFRNYGSNISVKNRGINREKLHIMPLCAEIEDKEKYSGMPFEDDVPFVFSGGWPYKLEGSNLYERMVSYILDRYQEVKYVYAGDGTTQTIEKLEKKYPNRFFKMNERKDLNQVFQHALFYVSTYPLGGGMMLQYALLNECIPLTLCEKEGGECDPNTWLINCDNADFIVYKESDFYKMVDKIMLDKLYYSDTKKVLKKYVIDTKSFSDILKKLIESNESDYQISEMETEDINIIKERAIKRLPEIIRWMYSSETWVWENHSLMLKLAEKEYIDLIYKRIATIKRDAKGREIWIYGAGIYGLLSCIILKENNIFPSGFFDKNAEKIMSLNGLVVKDISHIDVKSQYLVIGLYKIHHEVLEWLQEKEYGKTDFCYISNL